MSSLYRGSVDEVVLDMFQRARVNLNHGLDAQSRQSISAQNIQSLPL